MSRVVDIDLGSGFTKIDSPTGQSHIIVSHKGATIISWRMMSQELLFLSPLANLDNTNDTPIRGGIPLVFPNFNNTGSSWCPQKHGFARNMMWKHLHTIKDNEQGESKAIFILTNNEYSYQLWPYKFELQYIISLGLTHLRTELKILNTDDKSYQFHALFHNYFKNDIDIVNITGLKDCIYSDKSIYGAGSTQTDRQECITFPDGREINRIYTLNTTNTSDNDTTTNNNNNNTSQLVAIGDGGNCDLTIRAANLPHIVVWNPGNNNPNSTIIPDLEENGYKGFVCVEPGHVHTPITLEAGKSYHCGQSIVLRILSKSSMTSRQETRKAAAEAALAELPQRPTLARILPANSSSSSKTDNTTTNTDTTTTTTTTTITNNECKMDADGMD